MSADSMTPAEAVALVESLHDIAESVGSAIGEQISTLRFLIQQPSKSAPAVSDRATFMTQQWNTADMATPKPVLAKTLDRVRARLTIPALTAAGDASGDLLLFGREQADSASGAGLGDVSYAYRLAVGQTIVLDTRGEVWALPAGTLTKPTFVHVIAEFMEPAQGEQAGSGGCGCGGQVHPEHATFGHGVLESWRR